jgi:hypothetical protein
VPASGRFDYRVRLGYPVTETDVGGEKEENLGVMPPAGDRAFACPLCSATYGAAVVELCELAMDRGQNFSLFTCGSCKVTLVASMDHVGRVGITLDVSGISGEFPAIAPVNAGQGGPA